MPELAHREHSTASAVAEQLELETERAATGIIACTPGDETAVAVRAELAGAGAVVATSANRPGDQPGRPRAPNAATNSASGNSSPSRSRIVTGSGGWRRR